MTRSEALKEGALALTVRGIPDAPLTAEVLLRHVLKIDRAKLFLEPEKSLTTEEESKYRELLNECISGEPLAYIVGHREFYGLSFYVNRDVLIPRPETEHLVEKAIEVARNNGLTTIADIGTGSGVIAVCLALNLPQTTIYGVDISDKALEVAKFNAGKYHVSHRIKFLKGDLVEPLPGMCDLIVANLPYVKQEDIKGGIAREPQLALDGGAEGLSQVKRLIEQAKNKLNPGGYLLLEVGMGQNDRVRWYILSLYLEADLEVIKDLAGIERVVVARMPAD